MAASATEDDGRVAAPTDRTTRCAAVGGALEVTGKLTRVVSSGRRCLQELGKA
jgi:hypothetical protein